MSDEFTYLLNAWEASAHTPNPALNGYAQKREAVLSYVEDLRARCEKAEKDAEMRSVLEDAAQDYRDVAHYDDATYCQLRGSYEEVDEALATPDTSAQILARRDAGIWMEAAAMAIEAEDWVDSSLESLAEALRTKADELLKGEPKCR